MDKNTSLKLINYIREVAVLELPVIKLLVAMQKVYGKDIPENATFAEVIDTYINKIENFTEKAKDNSQENYDKVYDEFLVFLNADVEPIINEAKNEQ